VCCQDLLPPVIPPVWKCNMPTWSIINVTKSFLSPSAKLLHFLDYMSLAPFARDSEQHAVYWQNFCCWCCMYCHHKRRIAGLICTYTVGKVHLHTHPQNTHTHTQTQLRQCCWARGHRREETHLPTIFFSLPNIGTEWWHQCKCTFMKSLFFS